jgi:hypothetical protein
MDASIQTETTFVAIPEMDGQKMLNELNRLAPESDKSVEELKTKGWEVFYSFHEYEANGTANAGDLKLALEKIKLASPMPGDWEIVRAKFDSARVNGAEHDRVKGLLKKRTQQRIDADAALEQK